MPNIFLGIFLARGDGSKFVIHKKNKVEIDTTLTQCHEYRSKDWQIWIPKLYNSNPYNTNTPIMQTLGHVSGGHIKETSL